MITIALFNNKGGVGKTTLAYHLAHMLPRLGYRVLAVDWIRRRTSRLLSLMRIGWSSCGTRKSLAKPSGPVSAQYWKAPVTLPRLNRSS